MASNLLLALVGGAILSIAVAWIAPNWIPFRETSSFERLRSREWPYPELAIRDWPAPNLQLSYSSALETHEAIYASLPLPPLPPDPPGTVTFWHRMPEHVGFEIDSYGWPFQCLQSVTVKSSGSRSSLHYSTHAPVWVQRLLRTFKPLPTRVIPFGLALNTLVYAGPLMLALTVPVYVRRALRRRRRQCVICAYPLLDSISSSNKCPECGNAT